jgi:hypothetical protein
MRRKNSSAWARRAASVSGGLGPSLDRLIEPANPLRGAAVHFVERRHDFPNL